MNQKVATKIEPNDLKSFELLVEEHEDQWVRLAVSMLGNKEDALDAFQEGIIQVHQSLKSFRGEASFATWATKIMIHKYIRIRKQRMRRMEREITQEKESQLFRNIPDLSAADDDVMISESRKLLRMAIGKLPERQQMAVTLKYDGGMKIQEVADVMDCSSGTVKRYLFRAIGKLQNDLRNYFQ
jgi:RNA polymerase sigma-70 factor (ECF subfamily)